MTQNNRSLYTSESDSRYSHGTASNTTHMGVLSFTSPNCTCQVLRALHPGGIAATETMLVAFISQVANVVFLSCLRRALIRYTAGSSFRRHRCDGYSMFRWRFIVLIPIRRFMLLLQCVHRWNLFRCQATQVTCSNSNGPDERHAQNL